MSHFAFGSVPWTRAERAALAACVERRGEDWSAASAAVSALGAVRSAAECRECYAQLRAAWCASTRVVPTPAKLAEAARKDRMRQLQQRIAARNTLLQHMNQVLQDPNTRATDRLVRACLHDLRTARLVVRSREEKKKKKEEEEEEEEKEEEEKVFHEEDLMHGWKDILLDDDDGFGPFAGRVPRSPAPPLLPPPPRTPEPFATSLLFPPPARPAGWPSGLAHGEEEKQQPSDATFLLSAFEAIAGHRSAAPFVDPVIGLSEYNAIVKNPVCLSELRVQLHAGTIKRAVELMRMLQLMLANACVFNLRGSPVWEAASQLRLIIRKELEPLLVMDTLNRFLQQK